MAMSMKVDPKMNTHTKVDLNPIEFLKHFVQVKDSIKVRSVILHFISFEEENALISKSKSITQSPQMAIKLVRRVRSMRECEDE